MHFAIQEEHNFQLESYSYYKHNWRCDGLCRQQPPKFGWFRSPKEQSPGERNTRSHRRWWEKHQDTCGGTFWKLNQIEINAMLEREERVVPADISLIKKAAQKKHERKLAKMTSHMRHTEGRNKLYSASLPSISAKYKTPL